MSPKRRYALLYWIPVALLLVAGYVFDRRATALRTSHLENRLEDLSARFGELAGRLDELGQSMQNRCAVEPLAVEGNEGPHGPESVGGYPIGMVCRPRILGSGRSGRWIYTDVRHVDGQVLRYYVAADASPVEVRAFVHSISEDALDRRFALSLSQND